MKLNRWLMVSVLTVELSLTAGARAQGLLGQIFSSPATDDDATGTTRANEAPKPAPESPAKAKPKSASKKTVWRAPSNPPLPPPRPWGAADASSDERSVATNATTQDPPTGTYQTPHEPHVDARAPDPQTAVAQTPAAPPPSPSTVPPARSMVLIVRDGVRGPEDLEGRRIATGLSTEAPDDLRRMVEESAGVNVSAVAIGWAAGLASLARGEVDGVLLSLGPRVSASETAGVTLAGYQLLEIPLSPGSR